MTAVDCGFVAPLLEWWRSSPRPYMYPWRGERDPYRVLIAEILLQRTRRDKVVEVYSEFIRSFPRAEDLARASEEEVRRIIKPLGLEKRASYIVKLARELVQRKNAAEAGRFEELPGVGKYVASAARVLLGIPSPLVPDASIARVFSRLYGRPLNKRRPADTEWVRNYLNRCAPKESGLRRDYFLAIVDLAWEICKPRNPSCTKCPLKQLCSYGRSITTD